MDEEGVIRAAVGKAVMSLKLLRTLVVRQSTPSLPGVSWEWDSREAEYTHPPWCVLGIGK